VRYHATWEGVRGRNGPGALRFLQNKLPKQERKTSMKATTLWLAAICAAILFAGCATRPHGKLVYHQDQFKSRLEYLRFCQHYELLTYRCAD
jgi:hypothetical protein